LKKKILFARSFLVAALAVFVDCHASPLPHRGVSLYAIPMTWISENLFYFHWQYGEVTETPRLEGLNAVLAEPQGGLLFLSSPRLVLTPITIAM